MLSSWNCRIPFIWNNLVKQLLCSQFAPALLPLVARLTWFHKRDFIVEIFCFCLWWISYLTLIKILYCPIHPNASLFASRSAVPLTRQFLWLTEYECLNSVWVVCVHSSCVTEKWHTSKNVTWKHITSMKESENKGWVNSPQTSCLPVRFVIIHILSDVKNSTV